MTIGARALLVTLSLGAIAGCAAEPPVPDKPTYVDDVEPILRTNCFHCHGADRSVVPDKAKAAGQLDASRWDIFDVNDPMLKSIGDFMADVTGLGVKPHWAVINSYLLMPADSPTRMPPAPAPPLRDRDRAVLQRWGETGNPRGARNPNQRPAAAWLVKPTTVVVSDGDHDQVLGKITCGSTETRVLSTGATKLAAGSAPPCTATLFDGQEIASVRIN